MATIDLVVLGMLKKEPLSAYDIQKLVEYRQISKWVKINTPSIYKKVIQLEEKGLIKGSSVRKGKMPEKVVYTLTDAGEEAFQRLMLETSAQPIRFFLDFNAVIVHLDNVSDEVRQQCLDHIAEQLSQVKTLLEENMAAKKDDSSIPATGWAVLKQQMALACAVEEWLESIR